MCSTHPAQDITVIFDDEAATEIRTHSVLLMLASPVFHKMFTQEMKEKQSHRIELPGKSPEEFKVLLDFLEPGTGRLQKISDANVGFLSRWSDEYCMESLHTECIDFIKEQPATVPRVVLAHCLGLHDYATSCIDHLLRSGQTDWKDCYDYPELVQRVLERTFVNVKRWHPVSPPPQPQPSYWRSQ
ncbi:unnamed protein product [Cladocopium goreaui]|uniref:Kelch-like protein 21 n=1 Tax=Cladocopium goreaui TaxID=2562237 RepID=A0A9P1FPK2_9DINO|nr:unnamed protein product [Cladocopium goreaui]